MTTHQKIHQTLLHEWANRFVEQKAIGLTVRKWCEQNNLSIHKYNYWKHKLKTEVVNQAIPEIIPLSLQPQLISNFNDATLSKPLDSANRTISAIDIVAMIRVNDITIEISPYASETIITSLIKAVRHA